MQAGMTYRSLVSLLGGLVYASLIQASSSEYESVRDTPEVYNVRCDVRDLETTIRWNVTKLNEELKLIRYSVRYCPPSECRTKQRLHCFEDVTRSKRLLKVEEPLCKASISQLLTWNSYYFKISALYRNLTSGNVVRFFNGNVCEPITRQTSLSAPDITTLSTKTSITINLNLNENLQRTLQKTKRQGDLSMSDVIYSYRLIPKGQRLRRDQPSEERKSVDHHETYENIAPNEDYDIQGWYTVKTLKNEKSEIASTTEKTKPDRFPQWAQITFICGVSALLIFSMISAFSYNEYLKREKKVKEAKFKSTLIFEQYLNDIHNADPWLMDETLEYDEPVIFARLSTKQDITSDTHSLDNNEVVESHSSLETNEVQVMEQFSTGDYVLKPSHN